MRRNRESEPVHRPAPSHRAHRHPVQRQSVHGRFAVWWQTLRCQGSERGGVWHHPRPKRRADTAADRSAPGPGGSHSPGIRRSGSSAPVPRCRILPRITHRMREKPRLINHQQAAPIAQRRNHLIAHHVTQCIHIPPSVVRSGNNRIDRWLSCARLRDHRNGAYPEDRARS